MITNIAAYHFVAIDDADALAGRLLEQATAHALRGTVLVSEEGINLFLAGADVAVSALLEGLRTDSRFATLQVKTSYSRAQPFP